MQPRAALWTFWSSPGSILADSAVCPTSYGDSPYQSFSTFAGNPYFIDLDDLAKQGLLLPEEYTSIDWECTPDCINYGVMYEKRYAVLRCAANVCWQSPVPTTAAL